MKRPWMPLYIADYLADTAHFSTLEHGAYLLLIMSYWSRGSLPDDDRLLARIVKMTLAQWKKTRPSIAPLFQEGWKHKRIEFELTNVARLSAAGRAGGKASGEARRQAKSQQNGDNQSTIVERPLNDQANDLATNREALHSHSHTQRKKGRKEGASLRSEPRATRLKEDWWPTAENVEYALAKGLSLESVNAEAEKFRNYWISKSGNATKLNWNLTWNTWIINSLERMNGHGRSRKSLGDRGRELAEKARQLELAAGIGRPDAPVGGHRGGNDDY